MFLRDLKERNSSLRALFLLKCHNCGHTCKAHHCYDDGDLGILLEEEKCQKDVMIGRVAGFHDFVTKSIKIEQIGFPKLYSQSECDRVGFTIVEDIIANSWWEVDDSDDEEATHVLHEDRSNKFLIQSYHASKSPAYIVQESRSGSGKARRIVDVLFYWESGHLTDIDLHNMAFGKLIENLKHRFWATTWRDMEELGFVHL